MTMQTAAGRVSINSLTFLSPVKTRENTLVSTRNSAMLTVSLSKPAGYFVGSFFPVGPNAKNIVVGNVVWHATKGFFFETLKFSDYLRGIFGICDAETAPSLEGQFNHDFSHGAELLSGMNCII